MRVGLSQAGRSSGTWAWMGVGPPGSLSTVRVPPATSTRSASSRRPHDPPKVAPPRAGATVSVAVAHEVALMGGRAIACLHARDRNLLGFQRDLLTAAAYGVDEFLFVYGDRPAPGGQNRRADRPFDDPRGSSVQRLAQRPTRRAPGRSANGIGSAAEMETTPTSCSCRSVSPWPTPRASHASGRSLVGRPRYGHVHRFLHHGLSGSYCIHR
jgi:hypothetical protein